MNFVCEIMLVIIEIEMPISFFVLVISNSLLTLLVDWLTNWCSGFLFDGMDFRVLRLQAGHKYCLLGRLSSEVGWNHADTIRGSFFQMFFNQRFTCSMY